MSKKRNNKRKTTRKKRASVRRPASKYNILQSVLAEYGKERNLKWGKGDFARQASKLYAKTKESDIRYVAQNIDVLYREFVEEQVPKKEFPSGEEFAWWYFIDEIQLPVFDGVRIAFKFDDGFQQFSFNGDRVQAEEYFKDACYRYFRVHYSSSPWAYFLIDEDEAGNPKTDNKTYVEYKIIPGKREDYGGEPKPSDKTTPTGKPTIVTETEQKIRLEQERQKTIAMVQELLKQGFTKEEIFRIIGK